MLAAYGILEWTFIGLMALLVVLVSGFALFLLVNQVRNPGRGDDRRRS